MTWDIEDTSSAGENAPPKVALKKEIGVLQGVSIVFGIIVGSGIFVSPVGVLQYSQSVGLSFIMWLVTGLFSLLGAIVYAELGVRIPKSGGEYAYLLEAFGGLPAFICMWVSFVVIGGVSCAANSLVFAQYILQPLYPNCEQPKVVLQITALLCLLLICAINAYKVKWATRVAVIFSAGKIIALLLITGFGIYYLATGHLESFENPFEGSATSPGLLALAFYQGFWAFSGWNYLNFLVEEMDNPGRYDPSESSEPSFNNEVDRRLRRSLTLMLVACVFGGWIADLFVVVINPVLVLPTYSSGTFKTKGNLPLAIVLGLGLVTGLYMLANVAYLAVLSPFELLGTGDGSAAVAVLFANRAMPWIAHAMPVFVGASVFGSINSEVMSMSRLAFAGAREGHMPTVLALVHHENLTPLPSILAIMIIGVGFQFYSNLFQLIELAGFAFALIAALAVIALLYLRYKDPNMETDFQLPIFFPILFLFCDLFILCLTAYQQPKESLSNIILMLSAIPIYLVFVSWKRKPKSFTDFVYKLTICLQKVFASVPVDDVEEAEGGADV